MFDSHKPRKEYYLYTGIVIPTKREIRSLGLYKYRAPRYTLNSDTWPILTAFEKSKYGREEKRLVKIFKKIYHPVKYFQVLGSSLENLAEDYNIEILIDIQKDYNFKGDELFNNIKKLNFLLDNRYKGHQSNIEMKINKVKEELEKNAISLNNNIYDHIKKIIKNLYRP